MVLGSGSPFHSRSNLAAEGRLPSVKGLNDSFTKPSLIDVNQPDQLAELYISIYKAKVGPAPPELPLPPLF